MRLLALTLALACSTVAGCLQGKEEALHQQESEQIFSDAAADRVHLVDYYSWARLGTDFLARDALGLCNLSVPLMGDLSDKWEMERIIGHKIADNHEVLEFTVIVDDLPSHVGISGHRVGIIYDEEPIFWSEPIKESMDFIYQLDSIEKPFDDSLVRFFIKLTDPTTEGNEDACTSGIQMGSIEVQVHSS